jgi:hypothetical protein
VKFERTLLIAALVAATPAAAAAADHPRLFFGAGDVGALKARAQGSHQQVGDGLKRGTAEFHDTTVSTNADARWSSGRVLSMGDQRDIGNALVVFAFTSQIDESPASLAVAKGWLLTVAGWGSFDLDGQKDLAHAHTLGGVAIAYDMLYGSLNDGERQRVRDAIAREADALMAAGKSGIWWSSSYTQNHNWINHAAVGLAALAVEGEVDAARTNAWLAFATENAKKIAGAIGGIGDGTWHEGYAYLSYGFQWHLPFVDALKRSGREDLTALPVLRGLGAARAYGQIPETPHTYVLSSGDFSSYTNDEGLLGLRFAASRLGDGLAQAAADRWMAGTPRKVYAPEANQAVFEFLFYDPSVSAADLASEPLDWYGADQGAVIFRSGWDKGATLFALKSGPFGGRSVWEKLAKGDSGVGALNFSHDHADDNGFYLYANGAWAATEAQGYYIGHRDSPGPQANQTAFHNSMLVDGQGQLGSGVRDRSDNAQAYDWFFQREGKLPFQASSQHFAFATGDGSKLYPGNLGVNRWDRHALFLDRKHVVLFDVVQAAQPRSWSWLSHFTGAASQEGRWIHGVGQNGQALGVAVVAPQDVSMGFTTSAPVKANKFVTDGTFASAEVKTPAVAETAFLTALVPTTEAGWNDRARVEPIDPARPEAGLTLLEGTGGGAREAVALFARDGAATSAGGYALTGLAGVVENQYGTPHRALLVRGSALTKDGKDVLRVDGGTQLLEADNLSGDEVALSGTKLKSARVWASKASRVTWFGQQVQFRRDGEYLVVDLATVLEGQQAAGGESPLVAEAPGSGSSSGGGGCGSGGSGNLVAIVLVLLALGLLGRARRRRATVPVEVPRREERRKKAGNE